MIINTMQIYWEKGMCPISSQLRKWLKVEFNKLDYEDITDKQYLSKILRLIHAKPKDKYQEQLFKYICS